ncbi:11175_t:CDS:2 [Funneliformis mosseae]|uniref:11175_t:CDS:1 n=1 Tax=Funneliformis mosseae TaxID=27381 RepID=A0A9N9E8X6_FUNMO|nr:11175_t:CDS:2 [Funneliformis mosseae]
MHRRRRNGWYHFILYSPSLILCIFSSGLFSALLLKEAGIKPDRVGRPELLDDLEVGTGSGFFQIRTPGLIKPVYCENSNLMKPEVR